MAGARAELTPGVLAAPSLVGREHELEELQAFLNSAKQGRGITVFVSGEAGAGKTRLASEFLNRAKEQGVIALTGWCLSNAAVPYFPFFDAFNTYFSWERGEESKLAVSLEPKVGNEPHEPRKIGREDIDVTAWLMGPSQAAKLGKLQALSPQVWKDQTFVAVAKTLTIISAKKPVILFIDDLQWADSASLALIQYIARTINSEKVLLLATFRSEQLASGTDGKPHPFVETLRAMRREDLFKEIKVASLSARSVSELAKGMLGGGLQEQFAEKLADESQGNPLFVVESLRMLNERGGLVLESDQWRLSVDEMGIPPKIKDIVLQRLSLLPRNQRRILDAASIIGEKFSLEILSAVASLTRLETIETLDAISKDTSLVYFEGELYRFDHARSRDAVYEEVSPALKREYHAKVAETLESSSKDNKLAFSDLAYHYARAGYIEKSIKYALAAGQDALARWSNTEATQHFSYVLKIVGETFEHREDKLSALEGLGDAFFASCMFKEAITIFEDLVDALETGSVKARVLRKALKSSMLFGNRAKLRELGKKAEQYAAVDRLESARILMDKAVATGLSRNRQLEDHLFALRVFEEEYSLVDAASALFMTGANKAFLGMPHEGLADSLRSVSLFEEAGDFRSQMEACFFAGTTFNNCLLSSEAFEMFAQMIRVEEKVHMGEYFRLTDAYNLSALVLLWAGNLERALVYALKALELSKKTDSIAARGTVYSVLTVIHTRLGDLKHAEEYFDELLKLPPDVFSNTFVRAANARAVFFAGKNQWAGSKECFDEYFKWLENNPAPAGIVAARLGYAWALKKQGNFEEAKIQLAIVQKIRRDGEARFEHANLQAHVMARWQVFVGEEFEMRFDLVNVGRRPATSVRILGEVTPEFEVTGEPSFWSLQSRNILLKERVVDPFHVETVKLRLRATKTGSYCLNPEVTYVDDLGKKQAVKTNQITITAQPAKPEYEALPGRITTGYAELDSLLQGGIPEKYAVVLAAPSSDERELLIQRFLGVAAQAGQTTLFLTTEAGNAITLAETLPADFSLFLCGSQAELMTQNLPNVYKLKGADNLTEIDIALAKYLRSLDPSKGGPRIACIQVVSDVLLQHHAVIARKWLSSILANLKSRGFTTLAIINPNMHPVEEVQAILGLFDGEIRIFEKESAAGLKRVLKILKLYNQEYREDELTLTKENLKAKS
jgi:tetratricopeptide (TPR) repeat protein/KaiC/GvpD/RAD55 family RecA-like ATPase